MKKDKKSKKGKIILIIICSVLVVLITSGIITLNVLLSPVSNESETVVFVVSKNQSKMDIARNLKDAGLIKNEYAAFIYSVLHRLNLQAGEYVLDRADSAKTTLNNISEGKIKGPEIIQVKFIEGKRITDYAEVIAKNFNYEYDDVISVFKDKEFAKELISKYAILDNDILDSDIYYPLEGYLFPDTYSFYETSSIKDIIEKMVKEMNVKLINLKSNIDDKKLSYHEVLSMASIVETEGKNASDRAKVAQVIYKRLSINMNLGMDATTYYAVQKKMTEPLTKNDLATKNKYNTRRLDYKGLPVGPICSPSLESIIATLNPSDTNYIYYYSSSDGKTYFTDKYSEFVVFKERG